MCGCAALAAGGGFATRTPFASLRIGGFGCGALPGSRHGLRWLIQFRLQLRQAPKFPAAARARSPVPDRG
ncbi:hypothetical protein GCM10029976_016520 [Kribbella albertanoniae]